MSKEYLSLIAPLAVMLLGGCTQNEAQMPQIVHEPQIQPGIVAYTPPAPTVTTPADFKRPDSSVPPAWIPPAYSERDWKAIVIHHSATAGGNAAIFDKQHREQNGWDGVGYDFVIGNGSDSGDGEVEVTFRWTGQITGAHCKTPGNWANENSIGICLVGNFELMPPSPLQMDSLVRLVGFLQDRYNIDSSRIYGHNTMPGARSTACPGANFSIWRLKSMLAK